MGGGLRGCVDAEGGLAGVRRVTLPDGFTLNVEVVGQGPPLVLLHGFTGSSRSWGPLLPALAGRRTTIAIDVVGHGDSDKPNDLERYAMERAAADAVAAVANEGYEQADWLGYSMGGRLALFVAAEHPEAVRRLVLIGASPGIAGADEREARRRSDEALAARIERDGIEAFVDEWEALPLFASQARLPERAREAMRAGRLRNDPTGLANSLRGMGAGAQPPLYGRLASVAMPVLLVAGEEDSKYTTLAHEMAEALPDGRAAIVPAAGHAAQLENPEWCGRAIMAFLTEGEEG